MGQESDGSLGRAEVVREAKTETMEPRLEMPVHAALADVQGETRERLERDQLEIQERIEDAAHQFLANLHGEGFSSMEVELIIQRIKSLLYNE